jgi:nucleotide-binding universal stress UspA family protein
MRKILIAIDGSEGALKAVDYVGRQFSGINDGIITLFYVSPGVPPELWDDGHILTEAEKIARQKVLDQWLNNQKRELDSIFRPAIETLVTRGMNPQQIETKTASESVRNTPECILAEAKTGEYLTVVMGRCGLHRTAHALLGSIASRIINRGAGIATCVVG